MPACRIEIITQTASFRNPEFQNFHKTLDLPPPTTMIGLIGAALGLSPKMTQDFFDDTIFEVGVVANSSGKTRDTWKYNRRTSNMHIYDPLLDGSVIQREHLIHNQFFLALSSDNETKLEEVILAFYNPVFALTLGNSDSLAMIKKIEQNVMISESNRVKNCIVPGDVVGEVMSKIEENPTFSIYQTSEPIAYDLPIRFNYKSDYGKREVAKIKTFSFVRHEMQLNFELRGVQFENIFIPLFKL